MKLASSAWAVLRFPDIIVLGTPPSFQGAMSDADTSLYVGELSAHCVENGGTYIQVIGRQVVVFHGHLQGTVAEP